MLAMVVSRHPHADGARAMTRPLKNTPMIADRDDVGMLDYSDRLPTLTPARTFGQFCPANIEVLETHETKKAISSAQSLLELTIHPKCRLSKFCYNSKGEEIVLLEAINGTVVTWNVTKQRSGRPLATYLRNSA
jgi:hypothetical protein